MPDIPEQKQAERTPEGHFVKAFPETPPGGHWAAETMRRAPPKYCSRAKPRR